MALLASTARPANASLAAAVLQNDVKLALDYSHTKFHWGGGGTVSAPLDRVDEQLIFGRVQLAF
jgi:hypothetical protein